VDRILSCLTVQHDYRLVLLAALICAAAAVTTFKIYSDVVSSHGLRRLSLLLLTGVCCASGIWATHFISMLAYDAGFPIAYEPVTTAASFLIALVGTALGFVISASGRWHPGIGGAVIGVGIGLMHYTGMLALIVPGTLHWETTLVVASLIVGAVFASIAMIIFYKLSGRHALWSAAGLFVLAICGLHFTAMGAVIIVPDPTVFVPPSPIDAPLMVFAVSGATVVIMLSGIASTAFMENHIRRQREQELQIQNLRFNMALGNMSDGLCMFDAEKRLVVCNNRYCEMYRLPPELSKAGTPHKEIIKHRVVHGILKGEATESAAEQKIAALNALSRDAISSRIEELADGRLVRVTRQPMAGGGWVATHLDVTQQLQSEAKIAYMARHDGLTGIANRAVLLEKMDEALAHLRRRGEAFTFFMLDLDLFKTINDSLGHPAGDALLREVAMRLKPLLRETDVLSRLGGDEFAIIQAGEPANQRRAASALADRIIAIIAKPFYIDGNEVNIGTSIGITLAPEHSANPDDLLKMADMALYSAKSAGRNVYRFFEPAMSEAASARHAIESELRGAIQNSELELHYQPIVDTKTRKVCGVEALLRWRHPTKGLIFPDRFIRLAEETGLITQISKWVLHTACAEAATWPADVKVAVNLSPVQFRKSNLFDIVTSALAESGLPPERLELEITETALIESAAESLAALQRFKNLGITIVLDDFGTGYSSLSQLTMFAFDKIKIDRAFIQNMTKRSECAAIISATLTLAQSLEIATTAEGVEKVDQYRLLRMAGVTSMQGHLFKRPGPASEIDFVKVYGSLKIKDAA
jgi:diguanylate cyclase (GGDEF)-like protein